MACLSPLLAWRKDGKIVFELKYETDHKRKPFPIACGKCVGCRVTYARNWAIRILHEAHTFEYDKNLPCWFITLTFNQESLDQRERKWSVDVKEFQKFMKRLRHHQKEKIKYFHCGEYGEKNDRPHYHAIIFGLKLKNLKQVTFGKNPLYIDKLLEKEWPQGFHRIGQVNYTTASYVARYVMKKVKAEASNIKIDENGEIHKIDDVYCTMSRGKGLGYHWLLKHFNDVYPHDYVVHDGQQFKPPRYYDELLRNPKFPLYNIELYNSIKEKRRINQQNPPDYWDDKIMLRWQQKQDHALNKLKHQIRDL